MDVKRLFLDDIRRPNEVNKYTNDDEYLEPWLVVRNYDDFVIALKKHAGKLVTISYDHDLDQQHQRDYLRQTYEKAEEDIKLEYEQYKEKTGYDAAKFMLELYHELGLPLPRIKVHSMNPVGKQNIIQLINGSRNVR